MRATILMTLAGALFFAFKTTAQPQSENNTDAQNSIPVIEALDRNGDGQVGFDELENAIAALKSLDVDGNGYLLIRELLGFIGFTLGRTTVMARRVKFVVRAT